MFVEEIIGAFTGENRRRRNRQVVTGVGLGVLAGAALGILFAPKSGKETRNDISEAAKQGLNKTKDLALQGYDATLDFAGSLKDKVLDLKDNLKDRFEDWEELSEEELAQLAQQLGETLEDLEDVDVEVEVESIDEEEDK